MKTHLMKFTAFLAVMLSCATAMASMDQHPSLAKGLVKGVADSLSLTNTSIAFGDKVLLHDIDISIAALDSTAVPELDFGMFNVSVEGEGYRFLPHGTHFDGEGATVRLKYDRTRIPSGYTEDDIRTYYFDADRKCWVALPRVEVDKQSACVVSRTTHFTDMINGVIVAPESPETSAFTPTMMNDIKAADPTSKINIIMPPTANNRGSANLTYPFEMPPARNGMQPQVALSYNSDGGSGWVGEGWDISIPTIAVDTRWGVPRYNPEFETETYLLNGQMLAMMYGDEMTVAHRQDSIPRDTVRQFFLRQGGDFSKIIRYGKAPGNYHWEITDRNGVVYTYGGNANAVLKGPYTDASGHQRDVIAEWKLTRVQETHGDYIEYNYSANDVQLYGALSAKEIYLSSIKAGNVEQAFPHTIVEFANSDQAKTMRMNNARYGFLTTSTRLLDHVTIKYKTMPNDGYEALRTYALTYQKNTTFHKDVLAKITQLNGNGSSQNADDTVSFIVFDYYDDVVHTDDMYSVFDEPTTLNNKINIEKTAFSKVVPFGHSSHATAIGGTKTKSLGGSLYTGAAAGFSTGKSLTAGVSLGYSQNTSEGEVTLIDINGDGLPDRVYRENGGLRFCPQKLNDTFNFGDSVIIHAEQGVSLSNFSRSKTSSITGGGKAYPGIGSTFVELGLDDMSSTTKTTHYFADVNSDGLVDIVANGKVYFNYLDSIGIPTFTLNSGDTPSPIINTGEISTIDFVGLMDSQDSLIANSPMQDVVRFWTAPLSGIVNITGEVRRLHPIGDYDQEEYQKADSLTVTIQKDLTEHWGKTILKDDLNPYSHSVNLPVVKGDIIYFRLQSGRAVDSNGFYDLVKWSPIIQYTSLTGYNDLPNTEYEPNGHSSLLYYPYEDNVNVLYNEIPIDTAVTSIIGSLIKPITSDDILLKVRYHANSGSVPTAGSNTWSIEPGDTTSVCTISLNNDTIINNDNFQINLPNVYVDGKLSFEVSAESNVAWESVIWRPKVRSIYVHDTIMDTVDISAAAIYNVYNKLVKFGNEIVTEDTTLFNVPQGTLCQVTYLPWFRTSSNLNGTVTLTFKSNNIIYGKTTLNVVNGSVPEVEDSVYLPAHQHIWAEYFTDNLELADCVNTARVLLAIGNVPENILLTSGLNCNASVYTIDTIGVLGPLHRGWGQFVYNAKDDRWSKPIEINSLTMPNNSANYNPRTMSISLLTPDLEDPTCYKGPKDDIFIHGDTISSARLADNQVIPDDLFADLGDISGVTSGQTLQGTAARGMTLITKSESSDTICGGGFSFLSYSHNISKGSATTQNAFMDMNGDGYPDIVTENSIQYTNPMGGFSGGGKLNRQSFTDKEKKMKSLTKAVGDAFGGNPIHAYSTLKKGGIAEVSNANAKVAASISGSWNENRDSLQFTYVDINGDGLADMLSRKNDGSISARINLGYSFTDLISIQSSYEIQRSIAETGSVSLGFNIDAGSFSGGFGLSTTTTNDQTAFIDMNGDGLPDKVSQTNNRIDVQFNMGNGFDSHIYMWNGLDDINRNSSTTLSANASFSISIPVVFGHITITPGVNTGWGMSRPNYELRDLDGDGFLDVLESNLEDDLRVKYSTIARTNKLKTVTNSLGGSFIIDYEHSTPTYGLPGGKWVMSMVEVDYGLGSTDYYIPHSKTAFEYNGGRRDRHEREFLGFAEVISKQLNTEGQDTIYRKTVELYDTESIYTAGNLIGNYVQDYSDVKFTEVHNDYYLYGITNDPSDFNGGKYKFNASFNAWNDRGAAYAPLRYTVNKQKGQIMSEEWNKYYDDEGDHGLLHYYKYSDKGSLGEYGCGEYDYMTTVNYTCNLSDTNYIFGLPFHVTVSDDNQCFHDVRAIYDTNYPNHITQIHRRVSNSELPGYDGDEGETNNVSIPPGIIFPDSEENPLMIPNYPSGDCAITSYYYDTFGNIDSISLPRGTDNNPRWYKYHYDDTLSMYLTRIYDAFDLSSKVDWFDYRYGISNHREDQNGVHYHTTTDNLGRLLTVTSPNEHDQSLPTITFDYHPLAIFDNDGRMVSPAYAVTTYYFRRYYYERNQRKTDVKSMKVTTFVDGFGRVIETRKESYIHNH